MSVAQLVAMMNDAVFGCVVEVISSNPVWDENTQKHTRAVQI